MSISLAFNWDHKNDTSLYFFYFSTNKSRSGLKSLRNNLQQHNVFNAKLADFILCLTKSYFKSRGICFGMKFSKKENKIGQFLTWTFLWLKFTISLFCSTPSKAASAFIVKSLPIKFTFRLTSRRSEGFHCVFKPTYLFFARPRDLDFIWKQENWNARLPHL